MTDWGRDDLRRFVSLVLNAFVESLERDHGGQVGSVKQLREVARGLENSSALDPAIDAAYRKIKDAAVREVIRNRRREAFKRLMVHPLTELLQSGKFDRNFLGNYFNFLHLVLGDETATLSRLCITICKDERHEDGVDWDAFYGDERAKYVLWTALHRIAASFKRFDARHDWLIALMQNKSTSVSLAANAFIPLPAGIEPEDPHPFGADEFNLMFAALFGPLKKLSIEDEAHFNEAMGASPEKMFGDFWKNLEKSGAVL